jgi:CRP/FNR family transcriptional activator FtrB
MVVSERLEVVDALRACRLFMRLSVDQLGMLGANVRHEHLEAGATLFRQGEPAERLFVLRSGRVALYLGDVEDTACIARIVGPGETFAESCVCGVGSYPVTAVVIREADLLAIPRTDLCRLLEDRLDLLFGMLSEMSMRLRGLVRQVADLKMKTAAQRLASHLLTLTERRAGTIEISLPYEKKLLAQQLAMQPETLSRAFLKLQSAGVRYRNATNTLHIADLAALAAFGHPTDGEEPAAELPPGSDGRRS